MASLRSEDMSLEGKLGKWYTCSGQTSSNPHQGNYLVTGWAVTVFLSRPPVPQSQCLDGEGVYTIFKCSTQIQEGSRFGSFSVPQRMLLTCPMSCDW